MALVSIQENTLISIANAIRYKTGETAKMSAAEMPNEILSISGEGAADYQFPTVITCNLNTTSVGGTLDWLYNTVPFITFQHNEDTDFETDFSWSMPGFFAGSSATDLSNVTIKHTPPGVFSSKVRAGEFYKCKYLTKLPTYCYHNGWNSLKGVFFYCERLRELPETFYYETDEYGNTRFDVKPITSTNYLRGFEACRSLRKLPPFPTKLYPINFYRAFALCNNLDEIVGLPVYSNTLTNGNNYYQTFLDCNRIKNMTFAVKDDGTPYSAEWSKVTIDLSTAGFYQQNGFQPYNSGITRDKHVYSAILYAQLKDDEDWFTEYASLSRYTLDAAIATINSLPDCSAYLKANPTRAANTIIFKGSAGSDIGGQQISMMSTEQIAVATAKGWTVTLV